MRRRQLILAPGVVGAVLGGPGCATAPPPAERPPIAPAPRTEAREDGPSAALPAPRGPLSLDDCVRLAGRDTPGLVEFAFRLAEARAALTGAGVWPNPVLAWQVQDVGRGDEVLHQATVSWPVLSGWTRGARQDVARADLRRAQADLQDQRRRLRVEVAIAYYGLLAAEDLTDLEAEAGDLADELARLVELRVAAGDASPLEGKRARVEALAARANAREAVRRRDLERLALATALGLDAPRSLEVVRAWPTDAPIGAAAPWPALRARALEARPDLQAARAQMERGAASAALEERRALPLEQLTASVGLRQSAHTGGFFGLSLPLPLFDRNQSARERARADEVRAATHLALARRAAELELEASLTAWTHSSQVLRDLRLPLVAEREALLAATRRQVETGDLSPLDLLTSQRDAIDARRALIQAELEAALAGERLRAALGAGTAVP